MKRSPVNLSSLLCGAFAILVGSVDFFGRHAEVNSLFHIDYVFEHMPHNSAICFILSGIALVAVAVGKVRFAKIPGLIVAAVGVASLIEHVLNVNLGVENLLALAHSSHPGRTTPNAAVAFILTGMALVWGGRHLAAQITFSAGILFLGGLAALGNLIAGTEAFALGGLARLGTPTAVGFLALGGGLLSSGIARQRRENIDRWDFAPISVATAVFIVSLFAWNVSRDAADARNNDYFQTLVFETQEGILQRYSQYEQALRAGVALLYGSGEISRREWRYYVNTLDIDNHFPGISGIGFIDYVQERDIAPYLERMQADDAPTFVNHPPTSFPDKFPIRYIEPEARNIEAIGLDIGFEANRRTAAERARDEGKPSLTRKIELVQDENRQAGFLLLIPVYEKRATPATLEERRKLIEGWVYAPFIGANFLQDLHNISRRQLDFTVYDGHYEIPEAVIYSGGNADVLTTPQALPEMQTSIDIAGQHWTIAWRGNSNFDPPADQTVSAIIGVFGFMLSLLLHFTFSRLQQSRRQIAEEVRSRTRELTESENRYRTILSDTVDSILTIDEHGVVQSFNPAAEAMFGYSSSEVIGNNVSMLMPPYHRDRHDGYLEKFLRTGISAGVIGSTRELEAVRKDGTRFPIQLSVSRIDLESGPLFSGIIRDITNRKLAEQERLRHMEELESAKEEAQNANRMKSEFLANMSHEIRTPLNGVIGASDLLLRTDISPDQEKYVQIITGSGHTLLSIINDILDLSKIEAGGLELNPEPVVVRKLVRDSLQTIVPKANGKGVELIVEYKGNVPVSIMADTVRLNQVMINVLSNAIKFVEKGHIAVQIAEIKTLNDHVTLRFAVEDSGIGIPKEKLESIFDKFAQADATTTKRYGGTGLGLAITRRLVEMMGGTMGVESEVGVGTTFWFEVTFPIFESVDREQEERTLAAIRDLKVLVTDDNAVTRRILASSLSELGVEHETADGIDAGIAALTSAAEAGRPFDVAVIDQDIAADDGAEMARKIRAADDLSHTRLVLAATSGQLAAGGKSPKELMREGLFDDYMTKPVNTDHLRRKLHDVSSLARIEEPAPMDEAAETTESLTAHVLLVENELVNQMVATDMLESMGCTVDLAENGQEAVDMLSAAGGTYDVVLMDCMMPVMDGFEATEEIRRREKESGGSRQIVIAMTANAMASERERCLEVGMDDYLSKPVTEAALRKKLIEYIPAPAPV